MRNFVVEFRLPGDRHLFIRHGTNVAGRNAKDAINRLHHHLPKAYGFTAEEGLVLLYGRKWATWDELLGAPCAQAEEVDQCN